MGPLNNLSILWRGGLVFDLRAMVMVILPPVLVGDSQRFEYSFENDEEADGANEYE